MGSTTRPCRWLRTRVNTPLSCGIRAPGGTPGRAWRRETETPTATGRGFPVPQSIPTAPAHGPCPPRRRRGRGGAPLLPPEQGQRGDLRLLPPRGAGRPGPRGGAGGAGGPGPAQGAAGRGPAPAGQRALRGPPGPPAGKPRAPRGRRRGFPVAPDPSGEVPFCGVKSWGVDFLPQGGAEDQGQREPGAAGGAGRRFLRSSQSPGQGPGPAAARRRPPAPLPRQEGQKRLRLQRLGARRYRTGTGTGTGMETRPRCHPAVSIPLLPLAQAPRARSSSRCGTAARRTGRGSPRAPGSWS